MWKRLRISRSISRQRNILQVEHSQLPLGCSQWWRWHTAEAASQSSNWSTCRAISEVREVTPPTPTPTMARPLLRAVLASFCDRHSGVVGRPGQAVARVWEAHTMDPPTTSTCSPSPCGPSRLKQHLPKRHLAAPRGGTGLLFHLLNVRWEHPVGERGLGFTFNLFKVTFTVFMQYATFLNQFLTIHPPASALALHTAGAFLLWEGYNTIILKTVLIHKYLHLKSLDPAARRTLLGCQSRLRMVERIGFLMCLHTHLMDKKTQKDPIKWKLAICVSQRQTSGWCSPVIFLLEVTDGD